MLGSVGLDYLPIQYSLRVMVFCMFLYFHGYKLSFPLTLIFSISFLLSVSGNYKNVPIFFLPLKKQGQGFIPRRSHTHCR